MKNFFIFSILVLGLMLTSCSKDDNPVSGGESGNSGTWNSVLSRKMNDTLWYGYAHLPGHVNYFNLTIGTVDFRNCDSVWLKFSYKNNYILHNYFKYGYMNDSLQIGLYEFDSNQVGIYMDTNIHYAEVKYRTFGYQNISFYKFYLEFNYNGPVTPQYFLLDSIWFYKK